MIRSIFVVGVGRSGTSLLQSMFAAHPALAYMPETAFFRRYVATGILSGLCATGGEAEVVRHLSEDEAFARSGLNATALVRRAMESVVPLDAAIYAQMVQAQQTEGISWVGDKDPRLIEFLPLVAAVFPEAVIVNIIRDPRDVLLSKKKAAWSRRGHVWKHIFANRVQLRLGRFWGACLFDTNYHEIYYEELISSPHEVLSQLCERIGLPFDEAMLSFGESAKKLVSQNELSWKKETFGPLLVENKEKWKNDLPQREINLSEICCKDTFRIGGYKPDNRGRGLSWLDWIWVFTGATVIFLADVPYRLYRNYRVGQACKRVE